MIKSIWKSKTMALAVVQALIGILVVINTAEPSLGWVLVTKSVLDILLRYITVETLQV